MKKLVVSLLLIFIITISFHIVKADELDDVTQKLNDLKQAFNDVKKATDTNQATLDNLNKQLNNIKNKVVVIESEIVVKEKEVGKGEEVLVYQKNLLNERAKSYYKNLSKNPFSLINLLVADNLSVSIGNFFYQKSLTDEDRKTIVKIVLYIKNLEDKKTSLQIEQKKLTLLKQDIDKQSQFLALEVTKARKYQSELQNQIAQLTARQQQILAQKLSGLNIPQSAYTTQGGCVSDLDKDPGFGGSRFAFFTYGVPHRVGLNQYGAKGRAESGQSARQILEAYYSADYITGYSTDINIRVEGTNEYGQSFGNDWKIEEYLKHVYEVPTNWHMEALKAQAIAARSYALAFTDNGSRPICPSQSCQVVKQEENSDAWKQAVNETTGIVMASGGKPIKAWFSSTHGGYTHSSSFVGWSGTGWTKDAQDVSGGVNSFDDLKNNAYDKTSPWFYCDWGSRSQYNKTAWLKPEEVADIINILMLAKREAGVTSHLSQTDKSNPDGVDTWDSSRVKEELRSRGISFYNSISEVSVDWDRGAGKTTSVRISGDAGSQSFDGKEFKDFFNLRAPANIQIVGPLYNVEKR